MISIILVEPENSGNLGAVARVMKNFGFSNLILVTPKCKIDQDARNRAKHAQDVLDKAKIVKKISKFDYLIGTTAKLGSDYNIPRSPLTPKQLADKLSEIKNRKIGLLIGREGEGLHNDELQKCDFIVTIPSHAKYPTLNISHSVAVLLYELFQKIGKDKIGEQYVPAGDKDKLAFFKALGAVLDDMDFETGEKKDTQKLVWKKMIGKAMLTKRELFALFGFLRKIKK